VRSPYSRHKAGLEAMLDRLRRDHPQLREARIRPPVIGQALAAGELARFALGPAMPRLPLGRWGLPAPLPNALRMQAVHADVARSLGAAVHLGVPLPLAKLALQAGYRSRMDPLDPSWLALALSMPLIRSDRARRELGWAPTATAADVLREVAEGARSWRGGTSAALRPRLRWRGRRLP
jgi:hypothetical protein